MDFETFKQALQRAAYRSILEREPEAAALAQLRAPRTPSIEEREIETILNAMLKSSEYAALCETHRLGNFIPESWVMAELKDGLLLWLDLGDDGVSRGCLSGLYEPAETAFLDSVLERGMTFVDIGANIGWFTLRAAAKVGPTGRVIAIEPRQTTGAYLRRSISANGMRDWVEFHASAVGSSEGQGYIGFHASGRNSGGTWSLPNADLLTKFSASGAIIQSTRVQTLDDIVAGRKVDVIKIDIEGAEPLAFAGAEQTLAASRPVILSEVNFVNLPIVAGVTAADYLRSVRGLGYKPHLLGPDGLGDEIVGDPTEPQQGFVNVVFMPV